YPDAKKWHKNRQEVRATEGLLVLEIQDRIYQFLVACCREIFSDVSMDVLSDKSVEVQPEPRSVSLPIKDQTMLSKAIEAPYRVPAQMDLDRLEGMVAAKLSAAKDHFWSLREDPGYFAETLLQWREHRTPTTVTPEDPDIPWRGNPEQEAISWDVCLRNVVATALDRVNEWTPVLDQIRALQRRQEQHKGAIAYEKDLPEELAWAFHKIIHAFEVKAFEVIGRAALDFMASPPMRPYVDRIPAPEEGPSKFYFSWKDPRLLPRGKARNHLFTLVATLEDDEKRDFAGLNLLVAEWERHVDSNPGMKALISSWVAGGMADLSVYAHIMHQIYMYQPWAATFDTMMTAEEKVEAKLEYIARADKLVTTCLPASLGEVLRALGEPSDGNFYYPVDKTRNRETTEAMRAAEQNLGVFWCAVDEELAKQGQLLPDLMRLLTDQVPQRTPVWSEKGFDMKEFLEPLSDMAQKEAEGSIGMGELWGPLSDIHAELGQRNRHTVRQKIQVDDRALQVFKTVFFNPDEHSEPGSIAWPDFVHAMEEVGFRAEKQYACAWYFSRVLESIVLQDPHPLEKMPYAMARRYGMRLMRAFGSERATFAGK
ncbi:hypothetical protein K402DRAFT_334493, partial [Aulographum hederae CBS 113979]